MDVARAPDATLAGGRSSRQPTPVPLRNALRAREATMMLSIRAGAWRRIAENQPFPLPIAAVFLMLFVEPLGQPVWRRGASRVLSAGMLLLAAVVGLPFCSIVVNALKTQAETGRSPLGPPSQRFLDTGVVVFQSIPILRTFLNTL